MKKLFALSVLAVATLTGANAADFPIKDKPVTIVVPFAAGGPTDRVARDLAEAMRKPLGATVVVENVAGAGGTIGANKVAKAPQDGHTIFLHHIGMATSPALYRKLPYNTLEDFEYLGMVNDVPMTLIGRPTLPANNYKELATWIEQNKGKIMTTVPYKGTAPALNDLMGGQIDLLCDQTTNTTGQIEGKTVKAFAVTTNKRLTTPALKDLPTLQESGLKGFEVTIWHGLYAPKGTPADVTTQINKALKVALKDPEFIKKQQALGAVVVSDKRSDAAEHKKFVAAEIAKWGPVIQAAGVYAD
jgi:tripartite-type tricarboxylate transporter receptor subunit TctC